MKNIKLLILTFLRFSLRDGLFYIITNCIIILFFHLLFLGTGIILKENQIVLNSYAIVIYSSSGFLLSFFLFGQNYLKYFNYDFMFMIPIYYRNMIYKFGVFLCFETIFSLLLISFVSSYLLSDTLLCFINFSVLASIITLSILISSNYYRIKFMMNTSKSITTCYF